MITLIDMSTGKKIVEPGAVNLADTYGDEVLNAGWLPRPELQPELLPGLQSATPAKAAQSEPLQDVEDFLRQMYRSQG